MFKLSKMKKTSFLINTARGDIVVEDDFVVAIEWVEDLGIGNLLFSAGFFGSNLFARVASQGQWERIGVAAIGMNVGVTY